MSLKTAAWYAASTLGLGAVCTALVLVVAGKIAPDAAINVSCVGLVQIVLCVIAGCYSAEPQRKGVSAW